jgi:nicotinamidase-related amidase
MLNIHLLIIDPQNCFMDIPGATLPVFGAQADMRRLAALIDRYMNQIKKVHVSLDSHQLVHIAHPSFWEDADGKSPPVMTIITSKDIEAGVWRPRNRALYQHCLNYTRALEAGGKYMLIIWPYHGLVGSWGHNIEDTLAAALHRWNYTHQRDVNYVQKGTHMLTEHYGMFQAEVPIPGSPETELNVALLEELRTADLVLVAGQASSHCVKASVEQIAEHIGAEHIGKFHLLTDCMSPVGALRDESGAVLVDFPAIADGFLADMQKLGMTLTTAEAVTL